MESHLDDERLSRLIDGELSLTSRAAALDHLATCSACAARHDSLVEAVAVLRGREPLAWSERATHALLERIAAPDGRRRTPLAVVAAALLTAVTVLLALPVAAVAVKLAGAWFTAIAWLAPGTLAAPERALLALVGVAVVAPLLAYPLARWH